MVPINARGKIDLGNIVQRSDALLGGLKQQIADVTDVGKKALSGTYAADQWIADTTALWINGAALVAAFWGLPVVLSESPTGPSAPTGPSGPSAPSPPSGLSSRSAPGGSGEPRV